MLHASLIGESDRSYGKENVDRSLNNVLLRQVGSYLAKDVSLSVDGINPQIGDEEVKVHL